MKTIALRYFQPAMLVLVVLFWANAPAAWVNKAWSLTAVSALVTTIVLMLEFVNERHASWRTNRKEFATDLFYTVLTFTVIAQATKWLCDQPLHAAKQALGISTPWVMHLPFVLQVALVVVLIDFGQYWMHKAMHYTFLWYVHAPHHHITQMNAMKGAVGNPIELFLITVSVVALFDVPQAALFCGLTIMNFNGACVHSNVRYDCPRWFTFIFNSIESHSLHHSAGSFEATRCNYGGTLIIFDRLLGTFQAGESEFVGQEDRRRLTIWEQFVFPLRPFLKSRQAGSASVPL
jgi:sterol desaturase/sphingolipid hydroxylase (fatty acid hydroxylase superfamily)